MNANSPLRRALLLALLVTAAPATLAEDVLTLSGDWRILPDPNDVGVRESWYVAPLPTKGAVRVPGAWEDAGHANLDGVVWMDFDFDVPAEWFFPTGNPYKPRQPQTLLFDNVDDGAQAWLNGRPLGAVAGPNRKAMLSATSALRPGRNLLTLRIVDHGGPGGVLGEVKLAPDRAIDALLRSPLASQRARNSVDWVRDAVIYEVYLRSFSKEGTFKGLEAKLDELERLGVTVLWLMPIHPLGVENRKGSLGSPYAVLDYLGVNPEFGTLEDLKSLVKEAHLRGMKVILDFVANHSAWDNPLTKEHPDWYNRTKDGKLRPPVDDWSDVADFDDKNPELQQYLTDAMIHWLQTADVDGFRCDVAGMLPNEFWVAARPKLDAVKPVMMLAEDDQPIQHIKAFDLTYDWGLYDLLGGLKAGSLRPEEIVRHLRSEALAYPIDSLRMRFSSNHDKNAWEEPAITRYGIDGARLAAVLTFTLPGVPMIYNGQEVANPVKLPLFERVAIDWERDDQGLRHLYTRLAYARSQHRALRRGGFELMDGHADEGVLAFVRRLGDQRVYVFANLTDTTKAVVQQTPPVQVQQIVAHPAARGAGDGEQLTVRLPPWGYWVGATTN